MNRMRLLFAMSLLFILYSFVTFIFHYIAEAAVPVKESQLETNDGALKLPLKDCPEGAFHHPVTGLCIYCDCVREDDTYSAEHKKYYTSNCANLVNRCPRQFQFYDKILSVCRNCSEICGEDKDKDVCQKYCPRDRCCSDTEVYFPQLDSCESCSEICNDDKNEAYCIKNCKNYRKDNPPESSTGLTQTPETTTNSVSNPSTLTIVIVAVILTVPIIIVLMCCLKRRYELRTCRRRRQRDNEGQNVRELPETEMINLNRGRDLQPQVDQPDGQSNAVEEQTSLKKSVEESQPQESHSDSSNSTHKYPEVEERLQLNSSNQQWEDETAFMKLPDDVE